MFTRRGIAAAIGISALMAATQPVVGTAADAPKIVVAIDGISVEYWPVMIADKKGWFKEIGVDVEQVVAGSSSRAAQMTATNATNIGSSSTVDSLRAIDGGAPLKIVLSNMDAATMTLVAAKDISDVKQLKGKRVMVGGPKDITAIWWAAMARASGVDGNKDADVLYGGTSGQRFAALKAGGVEAATLTSPVSFFAEREGFKSLGLMSPFLPGLPYILWVANTEWLAAPKSREALTLFARAYNRAVDFINAPDNKEEASRILSEVTKVSIDDATLTFDVVGKVKSFKPGSTILPEGIATALKILDEAGDIKKPVRPVDFYLDQSFTGQR